MLISELQFHHLGLAVRHREAASSFLSAIGYECGPVIYDPNQNVELSFCEKSANPSVEVISPGKGAGPLDAVLRRHDQLIYHSCYVVECREDVLAEMRRQGFRVLDIAPATEAPLFGGRAVSFHNIIGFGLIELLDKNSS